MFAPACRANTPVTPYLKGNQVEIGPSLYAIAEAELKDIRQHGRTGRPLGCESFVDRLEELVGRVLKPQKRGPKRKEHGN
jgi:hypothetical protein